MNNLATIPKDKFDCLLGEAIKNLDDANIEEVIAQVPDAYKVLMLSVSAGVAKLLDGHSLSQVLLAMAFLVGIPVVLDIILSFERCEKNKKEVTGFYMRERIINAAKKINEEKT